MVNALKNIAANGTFSVAYLPKLLQMPLRFYLHYLKCTFHNISSKGGMLCLPLGGIEYLRMAFVRQTLRAGKKRRCVVVKKLKLCAACVGMVSDKASENESLPY